MKKGFTLIELLIVIVIIGLLVTVAFGALNPIEARNKAVDTVMVRDTSELFNAIERYRSVKGNYPWTATPVEGTALSSIVLQNLIDTGDVKTELKNRASLSKIYVYFDSTNNLNLCFYPVSKFYLDQTGFIFKKVFAAEDYRVGKICYPR